MKYYSYKDEELDKKFAELKREVKTKTYNAVSWTVGHMGEIAVCVATGGALLKLGSKVSGAIKDALYIWDPSLKMYLRIRRPLTRAMKREISRRFSSGETLHDIYVSMGII